MLFVAELFHSDEGAAVELFHYAKLKPCFVFGIVRMRSPVAVNTEFAIAGRISGNANPKVNRGLRHYDEASRHSRGDLPKCSLNRLSK